MEYFNFFLQVRNRFGLYDEISEVSPGRKLRQCNWIRFLRYSLVYNEEVNLIGTKGPTGEPIFDLIKDVGPKTELVAFFVPERPEEAFLLPAIQYLRTTLFKRLIDNVLEESPLDLSTSLVMSKVFPASSPTHSIVEGKEICICTLKTYRPIIIQLCGFLYKIFKKGNIRRSFFEQFNYYHYFWYIFCHFYPDAISSTLYFSSQYNCICIQKQKI